MKSKINLQNPLHGLAIIKFAIMMLLLIGILGVFTSCRTECDCIDVEFWVWVPGEVIWADEHVDDGQTNWDIERDLLIQSTCRQFGHYGILGGTGSFPVKYRNGIRFAIHAPEGTTFRIWTRCDMVIPQYVTITGQGTHSYNIWGMYIVRLQLRPQYITD